MWAASPPPALHTHTLERRGHGWLERRRACKAPARAARPVSRQASERERGRVSLAGLVATAVRPATAGARSNPRKLLELAGCKSLASKQG